MRVVRLCTGLTSMLTRQISELRADELIVVRQYLSLRGALAGFTQIVPTFALFASLFTYCLLHDFQLPDSSVTFTAMSLLFGLRVPLTLLPQVITQATDARLSYARIVDFLSSPDADDNLVIDPTEGAAIFIDEVDFGWDTESGEYELRPSGSGKSSLLNAIVGNLPPKKASSKTHVTSKPYLQPAQVWVHNATIADNISLGADNGQAGSAEDPKGPRMERAIRAAALDHDLSTMPGGLRSKISDAQTALSGGQRARVGLARALFALETKRHLRKQAADGTSSLSLEVEGARDIVLLDDPLAALDDSVARLVFDECVVKGMAGATRVIAVGGYGAAGVNANSKAAWIAAAADMVVIMRDGCIAEIISGREFSARFTGVPTKHSLGVGSAGGDDGEWECVDTASSESPTSFSSSLSSSSALVSEGAGAKLKSAKSKISGNVVSTPPAASISTLPAGPPEKPPAVTSETWMRYLDMIGGPVVLARLVFFVVLTQMLRVFADTGLSASSNGTVGLSQFSGTLLYLAFAVGQVVSIVFQGLSVSAGTTRASMRLHTEALEGVFNVPMTFFEGNPIGRITSRFGKDIDDIDNLLPEALRITVFTLSLVLTNLVSVAVLFPAFFGALIPALWFYYTLQGYYRKGTKQVKRLEAMTRGPLTAHLTSTINGAILIRSHPTAREYFEREFLQLLSDHLEPCFSFFHMQRWLSLRLEGVSALLVAAAAASVFGSALMVRGGNRSSISNRSSGPAGLVLTYAMQVTASLTWWVRQVSESERMMVSVERVRQYSSEALGTEELEAQQNRTQKSHDGDLLSEISPEPNSGLEFRNVSVAYSNGNVALRNATFRVSKGSKIAVFGRTGAGKSTIVAALMRMVSPDSGFIAIDGVLTESQSVANTRSLVSVVPQDPIWFDVPIRMNLDPLSKNTDEEVHRVLDLVGLSDLVKEKGGLAATVSSTGLSTGHTQLLCFGRALLQKAPLMVLDEATASTDKATNETIVRILQGEQIGSGTTVLVITHDVEFAEAVARRKLIVNDGLVSEQ
ncbi:hypothetical protein HDU82_000905 [Entophlyctis luteolus]|nr:hypothetical protein HDU82_000905 [Entophlyctis luteolus]